MDHSLNILNQQIVDQIEGRTTVRLFTSDMNIDDRGELFELYAQDGKHWIRPLFCRPKRISADTFAELCSQFTDEREFNTDPYVIRSSLKFNDFFDRYCNKLAA